MGGGGQIAFDSPEGRALCSERMGRGGRRRWHERRGMAAGVEGM